MDRDTALTHAARLLTHAEAETDRGLMAELRGLADSWIAVADVLSREPV